MASVPLISLAEVQKAAPVTAWYETANLLTNSISARMHLRQHAAITTSRLRERMPLRAMLLRIAQTVPTAAEKQSVPKDEERPRKRPRRVGLAGTSGDGWSATSWLGLKYLCGARGEGGAGMGAAEGVGQGTKGGAMARSIGSDGLCANNLAQAVLSMSSPVGKEDMRRM